MEYYVRNTRTGVEQDADSLSAAMDIARTASLGSSDIFKIYYIDRDIMAYYMGDTYNDEEES